MCKNYECITLKIEEPKADFKIEGDGENNTFIEE